MLKVFNERALDIADNVRFFLCLDYIYIYKIYNGSPRADNYNDRRLQAFSVRLLATGAGPFFFLANAKKIQIMKTATKVVATSTPRKRIKMRQSRFLGRVKKSSPVTINSVTNNPPATIRKYGRKPVAPVQETIASALALFFGSTQHVDVSYINNGNDLELTCFANGVTASIKISEMP